MIKADHAHWISDMQAPGAMPHYNFLRKTASDFGWDWGPAFAAAGLGNVSIEGCKGARIISMPCLTHSSFALSIFSVEIRLGPCLCCSRPWQRLCRSLHVHTHQQCASSHLYQPFMLPLNTIFLIKMIRGAVANLASILFTG